jgi:hypothetical protein
MFMIVGMGEEPRNVEIPCMFFDTKQAAEDYISQVPWLQCTHDENLYEIKEENPVVIYEIEKELYDKPVPPDVLAILPRDIINDKIIEIDKNNITYGQAAGLCFFTDYNDRHDKIYEYWLRKIEFGKILVNFEYKYGG